MCTFRPKLCSLQKFAMVNSQFSDPEVGENRVPNSDREMNFLSVNVLTHSDFSFIQ